MRNVYFAKLEKKKELELYAEQVKLKRKSDERIEITAYVYRRDPCAVDDLAGIIQERVKLAKELKFQLNSNDVFLLNALLNG